MDSQLEFCKKKERKKEEWEGGKEEGGEGRRKKRGVAISILRYNLSRFG